MLPCGRPPNVVAMSSKWVTVTCVSPNPEAVPFTATVVALWYAIRAGSGSWWEYRRSCLVPAPQITLPCTLMYPTSGTGSA